jgi:hypothetical protein
MDDTSILPPNSKAIPLTKGKFAIVDEADYDWLMQSKWFCSERGYALKRRTDRKTGEGMHRILTNPPKGMMPDHINGDRLDNRRSNLRVVNALQNAQNRGKNKNSVSMYKGVSWKVENNKWQARIRIVGKQHHIGLYDTELEAAQAYDQAAKLQHGQYARLNNVPEPKVFCGEIPVVDKDEILFAIQDAIANCGDDGHGIRRAGYCFSANEAAAAAMQVVRPYLRSPEPVSISLEVRKAISQPLDILWGYCQSALTLDKDSELQEWAKGLIERVGKLDKAWSEYVD